jgi:hypothetical protein
MPFRRRSASTRAMLRAFPEVRGETPDRALF